MKAYMQANVMPILDLDSGNTPLFLTSRWEFIPGGMFGTTKIKYNTGYLPTDICSTYGADGSAKEFLDAIKRSGIVEQESPRKIREIKSPIWCKADEAMLAVFPDDDFKVSYTLAYPGIGTQFFSAVVDENIFEREIAPARTFCSEREAMELLNMGLGKGANYDNTLVMGPEGPINNTLRFSDEPVRHKVLDLMGDLYLSGEFIRGHVVAIKSGHKLNMELVKVLKSRKCE